MPTYDYKCEKCGVYEYFQSITEPALDQCPHCGGNTKRLISRNVGIVFKGPGFYVTDSRKSSAGESSPGTESSAKESSSKESTTGESKPESAAC
ncbi:FmdB family transcriptional regulator [Clostridiales bacterium PH28_bin88]|nr:FmdB family transcriptional regulator [Clostridiales bacterium PH28_bin88]